MRKEGKIEDAEDYSSSDEEDSSSSSSSAKLRALHARTASCFLAGGWGPGDVYTRQLVLGVRA